VGDIQPIKKATKTQRNKQTDKPIRKVNARTIFRLACGLLLVLELELSCALSCGLRSIKNPAAARLAIIKSMNKAMK
jgi:hypothetical protein